MGNAKKGHNKTSQTKVVMPWSRVPIDERLLAKEVFKIKTTQRAHEKNIFSTKWKDKTVYKNKNA